MSLNDPISTLAPTGRHRDSLRHSSTPTAADELLSHYQAQWERLHSRTHSNAAIAQEISKNILDTKKSLDRQAHALSTFDALLENILHAEDGIKTIENDLSISCELLGHLERAIDEAELRREIEQQDKLQLDAKYSLALYKEQKVADFETFKSNAAANHAHRVNEYERLTQNKLKERQEAFDLAFKQDLNDYVRKGKVDKPALTQSTTSLEDIVVEPDEKDKEALDQFLTE